MATKKHLVEGALVTVNGESLIGSGTNLVITDTHAALAAANIDLNSGEFFSKTITANTTLTVSNVPAAPIAPNFILRLVNGGAFTVTWWAGIKWANGAAPALSAAGIDVLGFYSENGGTTWYGGLIWKGLA